jgi:hypothetical protein
MSVKPSPTKKAKSITGGSILMEKWNMFARATAS